MSTLKDLTITENIATDVMNACKAWITDKNKWFSETIETSNIDHDHMIDGVSVIKSGNQVYLGFTYVTGRSNSRFYRMLQKKFHAYCEDKIIRAIERKYKVNAEFKELGNHNPNPELAGYFDKGVEIAKSQKFWN